MQEPLITPTHRYLIGKETVVIPITIPIDQS